MSKNFFSEDAFGDMYKGTIFAEERPDKPLRRPSKPPKTLSAPKSGSDSENPGEDEAISYAVSHVRMHTDVDVLRQSERALNSNYALNGNFGAGISSNFAGKIFGGV